MRVLRRVSDIVNACIKSTSIGMLYKFHSCVRYASRVHSLAHYSFDQGHSTFHMIHV